MLPEVYWGGIRHPRSNLWLLSLISYLLKHNLVFESSHITEQLLQSGPHWYCVGSRPAFWITLIFLRPCALITLLYLSPISPPTRRTTSTFDGGVKSDSSQGSSNKSSRLV